MITYDTPADTYHADDARAASGLLRRLTAMPPARARGPVLVTKSMALGSAVHAALLDDAQIHCWEHDGRTKAGREERAAAPDGWIGLGAEDYETASRMVASAMAHPGLMEAIHESCHEVTLTWRHAESPGPEDARARVDMLGSTWVGDLKTAADLSDRGIMTAVTAFGLHQQAAWYLEAAERHGLPVKEFHFWGIEKRAPYLVRRFFLDEVAIEVGRAQNAWAHALWARCRETGDWPGYEHDALVSLPTWYYDAHHASIPADLNPWGE